MHQLIMMEEINALKAERAEEKQEKQALRRQIKAIESNTSAQIDQQIEQKIAEIAPAAGIEEKTDNVEISMKGSTPKFTKGDFSWQPMGRIHLDAGAISDDARDHSNGAEFRRARLGMQGTVAKDFGQEVR